MIILVLFIGIILGFILKNYIPKLIKHFLVIKEYTFKVKFNLFMVIHRENSMSNEVITTNSIEILVKGEDEDDVIDFVNKMVENETRVEIESIEII